jgi:GGDEF domain-containing protein
MMQPQVWITIIAILGVAGVALLVDYLKTKNQQLHEAMVELRLRRTQDQRQAVYGNLPAKVQTGEKQTQRPAAPPAAPKATAQDAEQKQFVASAARIAAARIASERAATEAVAAEETPIRSVEELVRKPEPAERNSEARDRNLAIRQAEDRAIEFASRHGRRTPSNPPPANLTRLENMNPREALAEWLNKRALVRSSQKPAAPVAEPVVAAIATPSPSFETPAPSFETPAPVPPVEQVVATFETPAPAPPAEPVQTSPAPVANSSAVFIDESLWASLLGQPSANKPATAAATEIRFELIQGAAGIPAGMHDRSALNRVLDANKPFTGLVVSIGVNQNDGAAVSRDTMLSVNQFVRGLLRDEDFGCQTGDDEFLLLCPGVQGDGAQHRSTEISERLWDFQLRGAGSFSAMFGWGDVHVDGDALSEAIASATERMQQTRRARKTVSLDSASPRRKVVAAV